MILVTVGMNPFGFNRLVQAADEYAESVNESLVIQSGSSSYKPKFTRSFEYASPEEMARLIKEARVVITHCAAGSILTLLAFGVPIVIVTRQKSFNEAMDDHQKELAEALSSKKGIYWLRDISPEGLSRLLSEFDQLDPTIRIDVPPLAQAIGPLLDSFKSELGSE